MVVVVLVVVFIVIIFIAEFQLLPSPQEVTVTGNQSELKLYYYNVKKSRNINKHNMSFNNNEVGYLSSSIIVSAYRLL